MRGRGNMRHYKNQAPEGVPFVADCGDGTYAVKAQERDGFVILSRATPSRLYAQGQLREIRKAMLAAYMERPQ